LIIGGGTGGYFLFAQGEDDPTPTATSAVAVAPEDAPTEELPTNTPTLPPGPTADSVATAVARIAETLTAEPTQTVPPTETASPTNTATPDLTATFLAECTTDVELLNSYTYQNEDTSSVPVSAVFDMNWLIRNSGECPLDAGLLWTYQSGDELGQDEPVELETNISAGEEILLQTELVAPARSGTYASTWQFLDSDGRAVGPAIRFEIVAFVPQTATPRPTNTPAASPTPTGPFGYNLTIGNCGYLNGEWECVVGITPYGGVGPYTVTISDADPPSEYSGSGPFSHSIRSQRCVPWVNTFTFRDDGTGQTLSEAKYYDPVVIFGCVKPE
jgi:hypothetical protein